MYQAFHVVAAVQRPQRMPVTTVLSATAATGLFDAAGYVGEQRLCFRGGGHRA